MKILITGSAGFLGKNLFNYLAPHYLVYGASRRPSISTTHCCDINSEDFQKALKEILPEIIIHTAALTNVDRCEEHKEEAQMANVSTTEKIVKWAKENNKKIIYISSDYVFPGETNDYTEYSSVRAINYYGQTKIEAERLVKSVPDHIILRPTVIFGQDSNGLNFLMQMLALKDKRNIPQDQISNPTSVTVLCEYVKRAIERNISGTYIATGPEKIDRYSFALLIAEVFNINKDLILAVETSSLNQKAKRPLNNGTHSSKIRSILSYNCPSLKESLELIKHNMNIATVPR